MSLPCDYHMHTPLCGHARGLPEEYAQAAIQCGLKEIGFSDHAPLVAHEVPNISMREEELPVYQKMIEEVQKQFTGQLLIKCGIEADYVPGFEAQTRHIIGAYPYDYVIGSVHFIDDWGFDNPDEIDRWKKADVNEVYSRYYDLLCQSATAGLFNIIGHTDLVKKFGHRPDKDFSGEIEETADVFKKSNVAIEINTSGLRKPVKEIYPSLSALKIYAAKGVLITFGSDAHAPQEVGRDFLPAMELARQAGYREYVTFKSRQIEKVVPLDA